MAGVIRLLCDSCRCGCVLVRDFFKRPDGTNIGSQWEEVAGDGELVDQQLVTPDANALFIHRAKFARIGTLGDFRHPGAILVTVYSDTIGAQARLVGAYKDPDNFVWAEWTFEDGQARLTFWKRSGGVQGQLSSVNPAGDTFIVPGRGAGVPTRLRFCWKDDTLNVSSPGTFEPLAILLTGAGRIVDGNRAGVGTRATGGDVIFDFYEATETAGGVAECPNCQICHICPDDEPVCVRILGAENATACIPEAEVELDICWQRFNGDHVLARGATVLLPCTWRKVVVGPEEFPGAYIMGGGLYFDEADGNWKFTLGLTKTRNFAQNAVAHFLGVLGPELPACDFCLALQLVSADDAIHGDMSASFANVTVTVSAGAVCCDDYYGDDYAAPDDPGDLTCCEERRSGIGMPATLYATLVRNGVELVNDLPLTNSPFGGAEYRYEGLISPHPQGCAGEVTFRCDVDFEEAIPLLDWEQQNLFGACTGNTPFMKVISCDPFHAEPSGINGDEWEGTIIIE
jgi:hypothetical protein